MEGTEHASKKRICLVSSDRGFEVSLRKGCLSLVRLGNIMINTSMFCN